MIMQNNIGYERSISTSQKQPLKEQKVPSIYTPKSRLLQKAQRQKCYAHSTSQSISNAPYSSLITTTITSGHLKTLQKEHISKTISQSIFQDKMLAQQKNQMQVQSPQLMSRDSWNSQSSQNKHLIVKHSFLVLNQEFQFKVKSTLNSQDNFLIVYGELVFNNGISVTISSSYYHMFTKILNQRVVPSFPKVIYSIDQTPQTLTFSSKMNNVRNKQITDRIISQIQKTVLSAKKNIITLLALTGVQMDSQNKLMKELLKYKKQLKKQIQKSLDKNNVIQPQSEITNQVDAGDNNQQHKIEEMMVENNKKSAIAFGKGTELDIQLVDKDIPKQNMKKKKRIDGGYFTIENFCYKITQKGQEPYYKNLCKKTLRDKKKIQDKVRETNQQKMKKQLQIVDSIQNKEYIIKYYYEKDIQKMQYVLMDQYDHSLQEYIYFFGDSLEIMNKLKISIQIVSAVIDLHQAGVVHRDLKPSNILIQDSYNQNGQEYQVKIIDFGESYSSRIKSNYENDYGCSHPYSPIQCGFKRNATIQTAKVGIQNKQIDYWSVGIILYQIFFRKLPLSYSKPFQNDIAVNWQTQLLLIVSQRQRYGLPLVQDIITILCMKLIKYNQQKRMKLPLIKSILQLLEKYVANMMPNV